MKENGMTLIELMVAVASALLVVAVGYTFYVDTFRFHALHERQINMRTRLQSVMDVVARDVRHAGYGIINPLTSPADKGTNPCAGVFENVEALGILYCNSLSSVDGGTTTPDVLKIMQVGGDQSLGVLSSTSTSGTTTIVVKGIAIPSDLKVNNGLVTLGGFFTSSVSGTVIDNGGTFRIPLSSPTNAEYPPGLPVYAMLSPVGVISYSIGAGSATGTLALLRNDAIFSEGIEDLQVAYLFANPINGAWSANDPRHGTTTIARYPYLAVRVSLVARELDPRPEWKDGRRAALENRPAGEADQFRRAVLTRIVELKNHGCNRNDTVC
jgi:type II secretory pathway pseudopilin PulG